MLPNMTSHSLSTKQEQELQLLVSTGAISIGTLKMLQTLLCLEELLKCQDFTASHSSDLDKFTNFPQLDLLT